MTRVDAACIQEPEAMANAAKRRPPPGGFADWNEFDRSLPPERQGSAFATGLVGEERVAALGAECERLVTLGATKLWLLPADGVDESCLVMQDVEGNEFCFD